VVLAVTAMKEEAMEPIDVMELLIERCAGLDVHKKTVVGCVRVPGDGGGRLQETRTFGTTTRQLRLLSEWLAGHGVTTVGMESTGVYWRPVYYALEAGFECWLVNAQHMHNVPGRKTDVIDAAWICRLVEHGLVRPSFVPDPTFRVARQLTRSRKALVDERTRHIQRIHAVLEDAGIKVTSVASDIMGVSGRKMLAALVGGERNPGVLADLAVRQLRGKIPQLTEALEGRFDTHHAALLAEALAHIDAADESIARLSDRICALLAPWSAGLRLLDGIPGVNRTTAEVILAEIGPDMSRFPTAAHLASWAGMCPGNNESAGKHRSGRTRKGSKWLRRALVQSAQAAGLSHNTYLGAQFQRLRARRGAKRAAVAVGHSILVIAWHLLTTGQEYRDLGADYFTNRRNSDAYRNYLLRELDRLGHTLSVA
jgi:transposase